jgi:hypothetical protein
MFTVVPLLMRVINNLYVLNGRLGILYGLLETETGNVFWDITGFTLSGFPSNQSHIFVYQTNTRLPGCT